MSVIKSDSFKKLRKKSKKSNGRHPIATVALYGPDNRKASKVVVGVVKREGADVEPMGKWFSESGDVRKQENIGQEILTFIKENEVNSVVMADGIIGCPHEEGVDYAAGTECPQCPFWIGRDRWTGDYKN